MPSLPGAPGEPYEQKTTKTELYIWKERNKEGTLNTQFFMF